MDFITYMAFDFVGTIQGLNIGRYVAEALRSGNIITPIILFFVFLSVMRMTYFVIVEKKNEEAFKDFIFIVLFITFFAISGSYNIWVKNLMQGEKNDFVTMLITGSGVKGDVTNSKVTMNGVPFMYSMLSVADQMAYLTGKAFLGDEEMKETLIKKHLRAYPRDVLSFAIMKYISDADTVQGMSHRIQLLGHCLKVDKYAEKLLKSEKLSKGDREVIEDMIDEIEDAPVKVAIKEGQVVDCNVVRHEVANDIEYIAFNTFNSAGKVDQSYREFFKGIANGIRDGFIPVEVAGEVLRGLILNKRLVANLNSIYTGVRQDINALSNVADKVVSDINYTFTKFLQSRTFNEWFMYKVQSLAIAILLGLFPLIVAVAFLPAFGYNFRLLFSYVFSYFLVKLWIPIYLLAYKFLTGKMGALIGKAVALILPPSAYAGELEIMTALTTTLPEAEKFTELILNTLAIGIPSALGGGALFLVGRDFYLASQKAIAESVFTGKMALFMGGKLLSAFGGKTPPPVPDGGSGMPSGGGSTEPKMTPTLKMAGADTGGFISPETKQSVAQNLKPDYERVKDQKFEYFIDRERPKTKSGIKSGIMF